MLPKKRRVSTAHFDEIMQKGTTYHTDSISLRIIENTAQMSRFSVVVSKKVARLAVDRNLLKRRLYNVLSQYISVIPDGFKGIFFVKKGFSLLSPLVIHTEVKNILKKALNISLS